MPSNAQPSNAQPPRSSSCDFCAPKFASCHIKTPMDNDSITSRGLVAMKSILVDAVCDCVCVYLAASSFMLLHAQQRSTSRSTSFNFRAQIFANIWQVYFWTPKSNECLFCSENPILSLPSFLNPKHTTHEIWLRLQSQLQDAPPQAARHPQRHQRAARVLDHPLQYDNH